MSWDRTFLLLLHSVGAAVASRCQQGATFSQAAVSPEVGGALRVRGVASLQQCVAAGCDLPGYDLAWLLGGRCYLLRCRQGAGCRLRRTPGSASVLAFLQRAGPYGGHWGPLLQGPLQEFPDSLLLDEEGAGPGSEVELTGREERGGDRLNQSEAGDGPEEGVAQNNTSSNRNVRLEGEEPRWPTDPASAEKTTKTQTSSDSSCRQTPAADSAPHDHTMTSLPNSTPPHWTSSASKRPGQLTYDLTSGGAPPTAPPPVRGVTSDPFTSPCSDAPFTPPRGGATDGATPTVSVQEGGGVDGSPDHRRRTASGGPPAPDSHPAAGGPPVAHAGGSHTLTLPNNSLVLRGAVTNGDQTRVHFLWVRDPQSPAAGDVLYGSDTRAHLFLANLVEGIYLFQLRAVDAQGRGSTATATVEVRPEPEGGGVVELEMLVGVAQVSLAQRDTLVQQIAALLGVNATDVQVRALQGHAHLSTVLRFSVRGPSGPLPDSRLVAQLRATLLGGGNHALLFRVLRVDPALCVLHCSGRGQCDPITKECTCDAFWTENLIRRYLGDGESNCDWRLLYVVLTSFLLVVSILTLSWSLVCCRRWMKVRQKTRYTILDEQERVELRPTFSVKHRSAVHTSSLTGAESDSDSEWPPKGQEQGRQLRERLWLMAPPTRHSRVSGLHYPEILGGRSASAQVFEDWGQDAPVPPDSGAEVKER